MRLNDDCPRSDHTVPSHYGALQHCIALYNATLPKDTSVTNMTGAGYFASVFLVYVSFQVCEGAVLEQLCIRYEGVHPAGDDVATDRMVCTQIVDSRSIFILIMLSDFMFVRWR